MAGKGQYMQICKELYQKYIEDKTIDPMSRYIAFTAIHGITRKLMIKDARLTPDEAFNAEMLAIAEIYAEHFVMDIDTSKTWDEIKDLMGKPKTAGPQS